MIFRFLLFGFHILLKISFKIAGWKNASFRERLKEKPFIIQVKIEDLNKGRYYKLSRGKLTSSGKECPESSDISIIWSDGSTALRTLLKFKSRELVASISDAITSGRLMVECDVASSVWFVLTLKEMMGVFMGSASR